MDGKIEQGTLRKQTTLDKLNQQVSRKFSDVPNEYIDLMLSLKKKIDSSNDFSEVFDSYKSISSLTQNQIEMNSFDKKILMISQKGNFKLFSLDNRAMATDGSSLSSNYGIYDDAGKLIRRLSIDENVVEQEDWRVVVSLSKNKEIKNNLEGGNDLGYYKKNITEKRPDGWGQYENVVVGEELIKRESADNFGNEIKVGDMIEIDEFTCSYPEELHGKKGKVQNIFHEGYLTVYISFKDKDTGERIKTESTKCRNTSTDLTEIKKVDINFEAEANEGRQYLDYYGRQLSVGDKIRITKQTNYSDKLQGKEGVVYNIFREKDYSSTYIAFFDNTQNKLIRVECSKCEIVEKVN